MIHLQHNHLDCCRKASSNLCIASCHIDGNAYEPSSVKLGDEQSDSTLRQTRNAPSIPTAEAECFTAQFDKVPEY